MDGEAKALNIKQETLSSQVQVKEAKSLGCVLGKVDGKNYTYRKHNTKWIKDANGFDDMALMTRDDR